MRNGVLTPRARRAAASVKHVGKAR